MPSSSWPLKMSVIRSPTGYSHAFLLPLPRPWHLALLSPSPPPTPLAKLSRSIPNVRLHDSLQQAAANTTVLAAPLALAAFDKAETISPLEIAGCLGWLVCWILESVADGQKLFFLQRAAKANVSREGMGWAHNHNHTHTHTPTPHLLSHAVVRGSMPGYAALLRFFVFALGEVPPSKLLLRVV